MKSAGLIWAGSALLVFSWASGCLADSSESRPLEPFDKIHIKSGANAEVVCGSPAHAVVTTDGVGLGIHRVRTEVEDGTLTISVRGIGFFIGSVEIKIITPTPVKAIQATSGGNLDIHACAISPDTIDLTASAGAAIHLSGKPHLINAEASSGATIGPLDDEDIATEDANIEVSSGATVRLCDAKRAKGSVSSGGTIRVSENTQADFDVTSGGSVRKRSCQ